MNLPRIEFMGTAATRDHQCFGTVKGADGKPVPSRHILHPEGCEAELPIPLIVEHDKNRIVGEITGIMRRPDTLHVTGYIEDDGSDRTKRLTDAIRRGDIRGLSCGYEPIEESGLYDVVCWRLKEISLTRRPANPNACFTVTEWPEPVPSIDDQTKADWRPFAEVQAEAQAKMHRTKTARITTKPAGKSMSGDMLKHFADGMLPILKAMQDRITRLEGQAENALHFAGVYEDGRTYERNDMVQRGGTVWVAQISTRSVPGQSSDWRMLVKSGEKR